MILPPCPHPERVAYATVFDAIAASPVTPARAWHCDCDCGHWHVTTTRKRKARTRD